MSALGVLERYRSLVDDWSAFAEASRRPLAPCVSVHSQRATADELRRQLTESGVLAEPISWLPGSFRLRPQSAVTVASAASGADLSPGNLLSFVAGWCHLRDSVSSLPIELLEVRAGDRVLDLCAAPGGKTAGLATAVGPTGLVVANDRNRGRLGPLRRTVARLGLTQVAVTCWDAAAFPRAAGRFDRVLADVPCSCEGTSRKSPEVLTRGGDDRQKLVRLQTEILASAVRRCKPGGRIVYATCTYAPEENEGVVDTILRSRQDLTVRPVAPDRFGGLGAHGGVESWNGRRFHPSLTGALRVWPHTADTGGFFVAVLDKAEAAAGDAEDEPRPGEGERAGDDGWPSPWRHEPSVDLVDAIRQHFGLSTAAFEGVSVVAQGRRRASIANRVAGLAPQAPEMLALGVPFARLDTRFPKITTAAAMHFGRLAESQRVEVDGHGADAYLGRREIPARAVVSRQGAHSGQVLVEHRKAVLGVGLLRQDGSLDSLYPKAWSLEPGKLR